jgi:hypothetical protein
MATMVTLDDHAARALDTLRRQAAVRGISLDRYLSELAINGERTSEAAAPSPHHLTPAEFRQWLADVSAGMPAVRPIPADFSRADLYDDHD